MQIQKYYLETKKNQIKRINDYFYSTYHFRVLRAFSFDIILINISRHFVFKLDH